MKKELFIFLACSALIFSRASAQSSLTKPQIRTYIAIQIASHRLRNEMKANASQYKNLIREFYKKRKDILTKYGWKEQKFKKIQRRIFSAINGIKEAQNIEKNKGKYQQELTDMKNNSYFTKTQKEKMIAAYKKMRQQKIKRIEATKPDWSAVKSYFDELNQLTDWMAGNIPKPPRVN